MFSNIILKMPLRSGISIVNLFFFFFSSQKAPLEILTVNWANNHQIFDQCETYLVSQEEPENDKGCMKRRFCPSDSTTSSRECWQFTGGQRGNVQNIGGKIKKVLDVCRVKKDSRKWYADFIYEKK